MTSSLLLTIVPDAINNEVVSLQNCRWKSNIIFKEGQ